MNIFERAILIQSVLDRYYPNPSIPLDHEDAYTFLVAVLLSAQTTDSKVNQVTPKLFSRADNPFDMVNLTIDEIISIVKPCGLSNSKGKAIWGLSRILLDEYGGNVPDSFDKLEALPGVGHKTASVVMGQWFGVPAFPVDTHILRCSKRWGLSEGKNVIQVERDLKSLYPESDWGRLHLQIIYFARRYCPALRHKQEDCPICSLL